MIKYYNLAVIINITNYTNNSYNKYNEFVDLEGGPNSLKHEELGRSMIPAFDQNQPPPYPSIPYTEHGVPALYHAASTDSECAQCSQRLLYVPHRDLGRRTQTSPTSPDIYLSARGIKNTHKLAMFDVGPLTGCIPLNNKNLRMKCDEKKNERTKKNVTLYI